MCVKKGRGYKILEKISTSVIDGPIAFFQNSITHIVVIDHNLSCFKKLYDPQKCNKKYCKKTTGLQCSDVCEKISKLVHSIATEQSLSKHLFSSVILDFETKYICTWYLINQKQHLKMYLLSIKISWANFKVA